MKPNNISFSLIGAGLAVFFTMWVLSCVQPTKAPDKEVMEQISTRSYPKFSDDMRYDGLAHSITKSLSYLQKIPIDRQFVFGEDKLTVNGDPLKVSEAF